MFEATPSKERWLKCRLSIFNAPCQMGYADGEEDTPALEDWGKAYLPGDT
jgi:hypothetical protein